MGHTQIMLGYIRVSTDEQARSGLGLESQRLTIQRYADLMGWKVHWIEAEGYSGKDMNPVLRDALDLLAAGQYDGLIVARLDRLARSVLNFANILHAAREQEWNLVALDQSFDLNTTAGRGMAHMLATFAEMERDLISERTKAALAARANRGEHNGRPTALPAHVVRCIISERDSGATFRAIADKLTADGVRTPLGMPTWHESTVRRTYRSAKDRERRVKDYNERLTLTKEGRA